MKSIFKKLKIMQEKKNEFESVYLRELFIKEHGVVIGLYSYGCFDAKRIPRGTKVGRYCSFSETSCVFLRNHGLEFLSLHPYLYNAHLGLIDKDTIENGKLEIEDDVWLGHNSVILPSVNKIGRGAVIAAGSIVTKNVPSYSIVGGNPAKVIKYRFSPAVIEKIESSKWWLLNKNELKLFIEENNDLVYRVKNNYE